MTTTSLHSSDDTLAPAQLKAELLRLWETLPAFRQNEVVDFARFLHLQATTQVAVSTPAAAGIELHTAPAQSLMALNGLVRLGGDAVADSEALYDDETDRS